MTSFRPNRASAEDGAESLFRSTTTSLRTGKKTSNTIYKDRPYSPMNALYINIQCGNPFNLADEVVNHDQLATLAKDHLINWEEIAPKLGINPQQIFAIKKTHNEYDDQKREALNTWKRNKGNGATFHAFITAAKSVGNTVLVHSVETWLDQLQGKEY